MSKKHNKFMVGAVTAAMVATAVAPVASADVNTNANFAFTDVNPKSSHSPNIYKAYELGIMKGYQGKFNPGADITRGQVVKALGKYVEVKTGKDKSEFDLTDVEPFNDVTDSETDKELYLYSLIVKQAGIFSGDKNNLNPSKEITRQQMAKVLVKAFGFKDLPGDLSKVKDNDTATAEYVEYIDILSENGITTEEAFRPKETTDRAQFASFIVRAYEAAATPIAVANVSAIDAKTVAVTFNTDVSGKDLKPEDFKVSNLAVTNVSVNGKVATLTLSSELSNGTTYTVDFEKDGETSSANFLYAVEVQKGIQLTKTDFMRYSNQEDPNIFDFVEVRDLNGKVIPESQIAAKNVETDVATVVSTAPATKGDLLASGTATVNVKYTLADGTILETGNVQIKVVNQDAVNTAGFSINTVAFDNTVAFKNAQTNNLHKTILYPGQATGASLDVYAYDANKDPLTSELASSNGEAVTYSVTSGETLFQVNKDTGAVIYQANQAGKSTVQVKKGSFTYNAEVELREYAKLANVTSNKSALTVAESKAAPAEQTNASRQSASLNLTLLDQYSTKFGTGSTNNVNGTAASIAAGTDVTNDAGVKVGQQAAISYSSNGAKTGKVIATADSNKVDVVIAANGVVTVTPKTRDIASDETVNLSIAVYDTTNNADGALLKTVTVPVTIKNLTEAVGQKVVKSSDLDASNGLVDANQTTLALWEVDVDGDLIKPVIVGTPTVNRGANLANAADDVVLSSNDVVEFEAVFTNAEADRYIGANGVAYNSANVKADNTQTLATSGATAEVKYVFTAPTANAEASLFGYDTPFKVNAKTGDSSTVANPTYLTAQTVDVRAYNSATVAMSARIAATNTVDISDVLKIKGGSTITIADSILGLYDQSEYIVDLIGSTPTTIAIKNGQDGAVVSPVVSLVSQNNTAVAIGPKAYGEAVTSTFASALSDAVKGGNQKLQFAGTLLETNNVAVGSVAIGGAVTGADAVTLATDKEEGTIKVLLTGVYRSNDFATDAEGRKNLLPTSQIVTIKYTK